ncbi:hypothetical protein EDD30_6495 [Couchioplanes caeruleus]|uniref:Uncharacterized protein n=3 Tax=Couchioplanes caeruleus TaxID=56438 RepID=A0A1K0FEJ4_9ACTN|nr:hypothetical protein BG844_27480 [Couchioplanes caeruleus subsp. caeruleus]ROP33508.1 hypothetical protein EDD30_6495 [Couchioplanes caeruleus]
MVRRLVDSSAIGTVAIVDAPESQWYARRAGVTAVVVGLTSDTLVTAVSSVFCPLLLAVAIGALAGVVCAVVAAVLVRIWPVLRVLWWWSIEITAAVGAVGGWVTLAHLTSSWLASAVALVAALGCLVPRRVRQFVWAWAWCLVVRHRLRLYFATLARAVVRTGGPRPVALPLLLWARPTPAGERVWLWLRPGLSLEALEGKAPLIAVVCIAKQVRIAPASERYAALLRVDIARRDPLAGRIDSPLALLIPGLLNNQADVPVSPAVPPVGLELADIEDPAPEPPRGGRR